MIRMIEGRRYVMRDKQPMKVLREAYRKFCERYKSTMTFRHWMIERGKVTQELRRD